MTEQAENTGPLKGLRVLDLSRILAGPTCTQLLGDLGADVIKIERPGAGDDTRKWGPPFVRDAEGNYTGESAYYLCANRNKRSLAVDIATAEGAALIKELLPHCDILIENFKVGGLKKYGLDYASLKDAFPDLVYCSITGFGQTGPNAHRAGYDVMAQGFGGIMSLTGDPEGAPMKVGVGIADVMCGMYAATAILSALRHRDQGGGGQHIDLGLVDAQVSWLINEGTNYLTSGQVPKRRGNEHPNIVPYQVFEASDGFVIVAVGNDSQYQRFCDLLGRPDLAAAPYETNSERLAQRETLIPILREILKGMSKLEILDGLEARGVPAGPVNDLAEVFEGEQVAARDMKIEMDHPLAGEKISLIGNPLKFSKTPVSYRRPPPPCGVDGEEVLRELLGEEGLQKARDTGLI